MSFVNVFPASITLFSSIIASEELREWGYGEDSVGMRLIALNEQAQGFDINVPSFSDFGETIESIALTYGLNDQACGKEIYDLKIIEVHKFIVSDRGFPNEQVITNKPAKYPVEIEVLTD
jgi:hypothetical protein